MLLLPACKSLLMESLVFHLQDAKNNTYFKNDFTCSGDFFSHKKF